MGGRDVLGIGKVAVALDVAVRCGVIVVTWLLMRKFWAEDIEPNADGPPVRLLAIPLGAYLVWNLSVIARSSRAWTMGSIADPSFLAMVGALSAVRLVWLLPLPDDLWWRHRDRLMALVVASAACTVLALGQAIRLQTVRADVAPRGTTVPGHPAGR